MKTYLSYAGINAVVASLFSLSLFLLGFQTEKLQTGQQLQWIGLVLFVVVLFLGMRDVRESSADKSLSYGGAVKAAFMIALFTGLFNGVYTFIHFTFVNPDFPQYIADFTRTQLEAKNMSAAQIDGAIAMQGKFLSPAVQAGMAVLWTPIMGTLIGLILAIFIKRAAKEDIIAQAQAVETKSEA